MPEKKKDNYISLQEAAKTCKYSQEYLSLRARTGKLKAVKIGRNWMTKKEWLNVYIYNNERYKKDETHKQVAENYIFLQEAAKHCPYSQEYLSLRARKGKLKAIKIGKNWATKKEWLEEYVFGVEEYKSSIYQERAEEIKEEVKEEIKEDLKEKKDKEILEKTAETFAPKNLPVGEFEFILPSCFVKKPTLQFGLVFTLLLFLLIAGGTFGKAALQNALNNISQTAYLTGETVRHKVYTFAEGIDVVVGKAVKPVSQNLAKASQGVKKGVFKIAGQITEDEINAAVIGNTTTVFKEYTIPIWFNTNK